MTIKLGIFDLFKQIEGDKHRMGKPEWLVVGLGNPGLEYAETRHNAGFLAISELAKQQNIAMTMMKFRSDCGDGMLGETRCFFMKPATYMNNSGEAVAAATDFYKIPPERVLVLYDDISLPPGENPHSSERQCRGTQWNEEYHCPVGFGDVSKN